MCVFGGGQCGREVRKEKAKQGKLPSSTRQISLKCSSGLGSSVSSAMNGVNGSASSC